MCLAPRPPWLINYTSVNNVPCMGRFHSNTRVFYIRIEILLTDINYMYYLYTVFVCYYVYTTVYNLFCV